MNNDRSFKFEILQGSGGRSKALIPCLERHTPVAHPSQHLKALAQVD